MLVLLITFLISITGSCRKPDPVFIPYKKHPGLVQKLANGNWEVEPGFVLEHWELLFKALVYKKAYDAMVKKMKEVE